jgi:uncharacterized membrane protein (DUF373 family)
MSAGLRRGRRPPILVAELGKERAMLSLPKRFERLLIRVLMMAFVLLLATIMKTYLTQGTPHYGVVLSVAIIAIARKVIIPDIKQTTSLTLVGIACVVPALTSGYYFMKRVERGHEGT